MRKAKVQVKVSAGKSVKNVGERKRFLCQDHHPAIISWELFDKVNC